MKIESATHAFFLRERLKWQYQGANKLYLRKTSFYYRFNNTSIS